MSALRTIGRKVARRIPGLRQFIWSMAAEIAAKQQMPPSQRVGHPLWPWLKAQHTFTNLIDIGANKGEFATFLATYLGTKRNFLFEPIPAMWAEIDSRAEAIPNLKLYKVALSDASGTAPFHVSEFAPASSLHRSTARQIREFPQVEKTETIEVKLVRLDDVLRDDRLEGETIIKIDVEGHENAVLDGGQATFRQARAVYIELSFLPRFEGGADFSSVHRRLEDLGFYLAGISNQIASEKTGEPLFFHALYLK